MSKSVINQLRKKFDKYSIDGYAVPKNDEFFSEFPNKDRLEACSKFSGSAGYAIILKKKNFLFVDGRYTIQAQKESGSQFKILGYEKILNCKIFKNLTIGLDPKIFTSNQIKKFFLKNNKIKKINQNLVDLVIKKNQLKSKRFFSLKTKEVGQSHSVKIKKITKFLKKIKSNYLFVSAPENVAWTLNIRGYDSPNSPIPNCRLFITDKNKIYIICEKKKLLGLIKEKKIQNHNIIEPKLFNRFIENLKKGKIIIDNKTCSLYFEIILKKKFEIIKIQDPIYLFKSIKNKKEIQNIINSHLLDGIALTKFLYWIKEVNKKKITEFDAQKKLEFFRKKNKKYLYPSFNTIAGTGSNGAIVHYRAKKESAKIIKKQDIFLCDSGGQYKYGTTDVTRTVCFSRPNYKIKNIFTRVLKGHIAVSTADLKKNFNGKLIDKLARKDLKKNGLDYAHGTGHGVGFFLNVHEGPQSISKFNNVRLQEGMVLSNEPGFYKKGQFGIRIENLIYIKKLNKKLYFKNLTLAPIDKDLINQSLLNKEEQNYLFRYHLDVYSKLSNFLNKNEKKWLSSFI